jgi:hypothetical protein
MEWCKPAEGLELKKIFFEKSGILSRTSSILIYCFVQLKAWDQLFDSSKSYIFGK